MIPDQENLFSDAQVPAVAGSPVTSTNSVDMSAAVRLGMGGASLPKFFCFIAAKSGTTPTIRVQLVGADNAALTTNPVVVYDSGVLADPVTVPQIVKGAISPHALKRFYGVIYTLVGTTATFTVTSGLTLDWPTQFGT
jgi:hypothetical protein